MLFQILKGRNPFLIKVNLIFLKLFEYILDCRNPFLIKVNLARQREINPPFEPMSQSFFNQGKLLKFKRF